MQVFLNPLATEAYQNPYTSKMISNFSRSSQIYAQDPANPEWPHQCKWSRLFTWWQDLIYRKPLDDYPSITAQAYRSPWTSCSRIRRSVPSSLECNIKKPHLTRILMYVVFVSGYTLSSKLMSWRLRLCKTHN